MPYLASKVHISYTSEAICKCSIPKRLFPFFFSSSTALYQKAIICCSLTLIKKKKKRNEKHGKMFPPYYTHKRTWKCALVLLKALGLF